MTRNVAEMADPPSQRSAAAARRRTMRSEVLGLRWSDVGLPAAQLAVRQRLASVDGHPELSGSKSNRSGRVIDLDEPTVAALRARRAEQAEHPIMVGPAWHELDPRRVA